MFFCTPKIIYTNFCATHSCLEDDKDKITNTLSQDVLTKNIPFLRASSTSKYTECLKKQNKKGLNHKS